MSIYNTLLVGYLNQKGEQPVPPKPPVTLQTPFFIEDISGSENTVTITESLRMELSVEKSTDGTTWETMGTTSTTPITATVPANGRLYLRCSADALGKSDWGTTIKASGTHNVGGNIMSMLYGSGFTGNETSLKGGYAFFSLFRGDKTLVSAEDLLLPATTLSEKCYDEMFTGCSSLTTAPELPATTLAEYCYANMFYNCSSLTEAPELPATTLVKYCYYQMFFNCTSLTEAPELPAMTLAERCYSLMFYNCTSLNSITCHATDISASDCTFGWIVYVPSTGTFYTPSTTPWSRDTNGIPSGWTRIDI